jgi:hypothetical protein
MRQNRNNPESFLDKTGCIGIKLSVNLDTRQSFWNISEDDANKIGSFVGLWYDHISIEKKNTITIKDIPTDVIQE